MSAPASPDRPPVSFPGFRDLAPRFDGFIVDQWGVLHDGTNPYPGAAECLKRLREDGRRVVVLSNSGKVTAENVERMTAAGFPPDSYDSFISAGEDARRALLGGIYEGLGRRCFVFRREDDGALVEGLSLTFVQSIEEADFLFLIGVPEAHDLIAHYAPILGQAGARGLPMICANPDLFRVTKHGLAEAPGLLARYYEEKGGTVHYHGKPYMPIYRSTLAELAGLSPDRILAIGDSIDHDMLGASRAGIPSALVTSGIHADELQSPLGRLPAPDRWSTFAKAAPAQPDYLVPGFIW